jgi:sorbitol/mannitol transport system permease protein
MRRSGHGLLTTLTWIVTLLIFTPVLLLIVTAFKTEVEAVQSPPSLIFEPTLENIADAVSSGRYTHFLRNSVIAVSVSTVLAFIIGIPAAYALAFYPGRRSADVSFWVLSTRFMPVVAVVVPIYVVFQQIGLRDTLQGLIILYTAMATPFVILMMRAYYLDISREIVEAAAIDGASSWRILLSVITPLSRTGIAAAAILVFIFAWNELFLGLMLTRTQAPTLPVFLASLQTSKGLYWAQMSAAALLSVWPAVLLGWLAQRNLARGLTMGAVK